MPATKIQNESEVLRWFDEGKTYAWMMDTYLNKYGIATTQSMWSNFRRSRGLEMRITRDDSLIPWAVKPEHRGSAIVRALRFEARRREGRPITQDQQDRVDSLVRKLKDADAVVHYDEDTDQGFFFVPREAQDTDLVRRPRTTKRRTRSQDNA